MTEAVRDLKAYAPVYLSIAGIKGEIKARLSVREYANVH